MITPKFSSIALSRKFFLRGSVAFEYVVRLREVQQKFLCMFFVTTTELQWFLDCVANRV